jgi:D-arabinose 1-dehydrogenase-like Zn-dependent alcohol dehydrogenase
MVRAEVQALENSKDEQKAKVAEQLGTWAAVSDDNRVAISREGGADALVALVVTGSDDAKWQRALRNLAHNGESKKAICEGWWHYGIGTPCQAWRRKIARGCQ